MILVSHMIVGAAIGSRIHNLWLLFFISIALHYAFDALPHWEYHLRFQGSNPPKKKLIAFAAKIIIDLLTGVILVFFLAKNSPDRSFMLLAALFSLLPDGLTFLYIALKKVFGYDDKILKKLFHFHHTVHISKNKNSPVWGTAIELLIIIFSLFVLLR